LLRTTDFDQAPAETLSNKSIFVTNGSVNINTGWTLFKSIVSFVPSLPTPGNSDVIFIQTSGSQNLQAGNGMNQIGNAFNVVGTLNRVVVGASVNIASNYVGQSSITTLGTVSTGVWNGTLISPQFGGSGISNPTTNNVLISTGASAFTLKANPASAFVGLTDTQALTNKTLTANTNTITARSLFVNSGAASVSTFVAPVPSIGQVLTANSTTTAIWQTPTIPTPSWSLTGNAGTNSATNFLGATDNQSIVVATNGIAGNNRLVVGNNGRLEPINGRASVFLGNGAGPVSGGSQNVFVGNAVGTVCTSNNNSGVGSGCLSSLLAGGENCGYGSNCLTALTTGNNNCNYGVSCMPSMNASSNTAFGFQTGFLTTGGSFNTLMGNQAGYSITNGINNICIGSSAGGTVSNYSNSILIGNVDAGISNVIRIGQPGTHNTNFQSGIRGVTPSINDSLPMYCNSVGQLTTLAPSYASTSVFNTTVVGPWASQLLTINFIKVGNVIQASFSNFGDFIITVSAQNITGSAVFPVGFRPTNNKYFPVMVFSDPSAGLIKLGLLTILTTGAYKIQPMSPSGLAPVTFGNPGQFAGFTALDVTYT